jgi:hypothetical protein
MLWKETLKMNFIDPVAKKNAIIEDKKRKAAAAQAALSTTSKEPIKGCNPEDAANKLRIIFDNSGSMNSHVNNNWSGPTLIQEARRGVVEFLRNCNPLKDAVAVHLLNRYSNGPWDDEEDSHSSKVASLVNNATLTSDLVYLASEIDNEAIRPTGGTPLYESILSALESKPRASRLIAFSDGAPNNFNNEDAAIASAKGMEIPIDTVYFGSAGDTGASVLKRLAEKTGGIFLVFDPSRGVSFGDAFKYLSPVKRLMLMDSDFKAKLQRGEVK